MRGVVARIVSLSTAVGGAVCIRGPSGCRRGRGLGVPILFAVGRDLVVVERAILNRIAKLIAGDANIRILIALVFVGTAASIRVHAIRDTDCIPFIIASLAIHDLIAEPAEWDAGSVRLALVFVVGAREQSAELLIASVVAVVVTVAPPQDRDALSGVAHKEGVNVGLIPWHRHNAVIIKSPEMRLVHISDTAPTLEGGE